MYLHLTPHRQPRHSGPYPQDSVPKLPKRPSSKNILGDLLGDGIFNVDGEMWKFQRQVASHEFNTKSLRNLLKSFLITRFR
ncbi:Cytochrome P450 94A2 [Bienertia sinuspersici]